MILDMFAVLLLVIIAGAIACMATYKGGDDEGDDER